MNILHNNIQLIRSNLIDLLDETSSDDELNLLLKSIKETNSELYDIMLLLQSNINTDKITNRNQFIKVINKILDIQTNTLDLLESNSITYSNADQNKSVKQVDSISEKSVISTAISKEPKLLYFIFFIIIIIFLFIMDLLDPGFSNMISHIKVIK